VSHKLVDLSHEVEHGMITYKGLPAPIICDFLSRGDSRKHYADGTEFNIGKIEMVANTGTYVDSPFHRFADGIDLSALPLESLVDLEGIVVRAQEFGRAISAKAFYGLEVKGKAVLIHTGWSRHWRTDRYFEGHPFLTRDEAQYLADSGAAFIGVDTYTIDDTTDGTRPAHTILLGKRIPICEHMCGLENLPDHGFRFHAAPVKVKALGTFPVRAYAILDS
jgi:kynurenine formamidase